MHIFHSFSLIQKNKPYVNHHKDPRVHRVSSLKHLFKKKIKLIVIMQKKTVFSFPPHF